MGKLGPKFADRECERLGKMLTVILRTKWSVVIIYNAFITLLQRSVTSCNDTQLFVTLRYALYRLQLAHAVGECILRRGDSDVG